MTDHERDGDSICAWLLETVDQSHRYFCTTANEDSDAAPALRCLTADPWKAMRFESAEAARSFYGGLSAMKPLAPLRPVQHGFAPLREDMPEQATLDVREVLALRAKAAAYDGLVSLLRFTEVRCSAHDGTVSVLAEEWVEPYHDSAGHLEVRAHGTGPSLAEAVRQAGEATSGS